MFEILKSFPLQLPQSVITSGNVRKILRLPVNYVWKHEVLSSESDTLFFFKTSSYELSRLHAVFQNSNCSWNVFQIFRTNLVGSNDPIDHKLTDSSRKIQVELSTDEIGSKKRGKRKNIETLPIRRSRSAYHRPYLRSVRVHCPSPAGGVIHSILPSSPVSYQHIHF